MNIKILMGMSSYFLSTLPKKTYFRDQFVTCPTFRILGHGMSEIGGLLS